MPWESHLLTRLHFPEWSPDSVGQTDTRQRVRDHHIWVGYSSRILDARDSPLEGWTPVSVADGVVALVSQLFTSVSSPFSHSTPSPLAYCMYCRVISSDICVPLSEIVHSPWSRVVPSVNSHRICHDLPLHEPVHEKADHTQYLLWSVTRIDNRDDCVHGRLHAVWGYHLSSDYEDVRGSRSSEKGVQRVAWDFLEKVFIDISSVSDKFDNCFSLRIFREYNPDTPYTASEKSRISYCRSNIETFEVPFFDFFYSLEDLYATKFWLLTSEFEPILNHTKILHIPFFSQYFCEISCNYANRIICPLIIQWIDKNRERNGWRSEVLRERFRNVLESYSSHDRSIHISFEVQLFGSGKYIWQNVLSL